MKLKTRQGGATRCLSYSLPMGLAVDGSETCHITFHVQSAADCQVLMRAASENLGIEIRAKKAQLDRYMADVPKSLDFAGDESRKHREHAKAELAIMQGMIRDMTLAMMSKCVEEWETNLHDEETGQAVEPTDKNFRDLLGFAYPDNGISAFPELTAALDAFRDDALADVDVAEQEAEDAGNSSKP